MKLNPLFAMIFVIVFSSFAFSQSVVVTPKKVTYKRVKPISDYKKTFTVIYPKVKATTPSLSKKIETTISYEKVSDLNVKEELSDIQWVENASYEVDYNKNGILALTLSVEGSGAYPSSYNRRIVVAIKTGNRVKPIDVFSNLPGLTANGRKAQQAEIKQAVIEIKKENPDEENPGDLFKESKFSTKNLDEFSITDQGVMFYYDYGFPHVIQALQPDGQYFFTWAQLKPFIKRGGLLEQFIR